MAYVPETWNYKYLNVVKKKLISKSDYLQCYFHRSALHPPYEYSYFLNESVQKFHRVVMATWFTTRKKLTYLSNIWWFCKTVWRFNKEINIPAFPFSHSAQYQHRICVLLLALRINLFCFLKHQPTIFCNGRQVPVMAMRHCSKVTERNF